MPHSRRNDLLIPTLGVLFDILAIESAFLISYWVRFHTSLLDFLPLTEDIPPLDAYLLGSLVIIPVWLLLFRSRKMYGARRNVSLADEFLNILKIVTVGMLIVMSAAFFYRAFSYSRVVFGLLWILSIFNVSVGRLLLYRLEIGLYRSGKELRNAVIIGSNATANRIFEVLHNHPLLGFTITGYFAEHQSTSQSRLSSVPYLGTFDAVATTVASKQIELVLVALPYTDHVKIYSILQECEGVNVEFMMVPDMLELLAGSMQMREIEGIPFIRLKGNPMTTWGRISKRLFDIVVSLILLLLFSPLLLLAALAIKAGSKGPVFFKQERLGLDEERFRMLKFRTMVVGAEKQDADAGLGIPDDPRQTSVGRFLRKTSIDELPQLINVLQGSMSLVGPRPERPYFVNQFKEFIPKYLDRHRVKTGMTGWAQVNGLRGNSSLEDRIKYDIYYIENWSMEFDLKILLKTLGALVPHKEKKTA
jgi:exopolysaccharide biosynthesis polyprenyl glycosylphosphotransferase